MKKALPVFFFLYSFFFSYSQPKLVVGIVVDQMRYDYIQRYWSKFGNDGFKRLINEGYSCKNVNYNYVPTFTGPGHASIYSGAPPSVNGIVSNTWINRETRKPAYCVEDKSVNSLGGDSIAGAMSPKNLLAPSIGEELRRKSKNKSKVIGISLKDRGAILPAGHNASASYWYDGTNGKFISSTYYMKELPQWVNDFNKKEDAKKYLSEPWTTILPIEQYTESDADNNECENLLKGKLTPVFPYDLPALMKDNGGFGLLRITPFGNTILKDFAAAAIKNENLGKGKTSDFLCVSFSSTDYIGHNFGPQSVEAEDCYIRLDKDLADFLKFIDEWIGKNNALIFLTADHGAGEAVPCLWKKNIPAGIVDEKVIADSLKKFFMRTYNDSLLIAVADFNVYIDREKANKKGLSVENIMYKTCQYLLTQNGIADAISAATLTEEKNFFVDGSARDSIRMKVKAGFYPNRSGDVIFVLKPNWLEGFRKGTSHGSPYSYDTHVPLLLWGYKVKQGSSNESLAITRIAPTVSKLLKIRKPKGCKAKPIKNIIK